MILAPCNNRPRMKRALHRQRGMGLVEALITLLLTAIIGMGMVYLMGRSAVAQKDMNVLGITVGAMRNQIMSGQCNDNNAVNSTLEVGSAGISVPAQCKSHETVVRITSDAESFTADKVPHIHIPRVSTKNDSTSRNLFGGKVVMNP